jgi:hypothetical protein
MPKSKEGAWLEVMGGVGVAFIFVGGILAVYGGLFDMGFFVLGVMLLVGGGVPMATIFVVLQKTEKTTEVKGMDPRFINAVRDVCERLQTQFSNPVKMDIYERGHRANIENGWRASFFSAPSTITIYEEIDVRKEPERIDPLAPRYTQLKMEKKKGVRGMFAFSLNSSLRKIALFIGMEIGPIAAIFALDIIRFFRGISNIFGVILSYVVLLPIFTASLVSWVTFIRNLRKKPQKKKDLRMLCAFREGSPIPVLIIDDVRGKVETPIRWVFNNIDVTYEKRIDKKEEVERSRLVEIMERGEL